jgi:three-Cys-motif partner protein
MAEEKFFDEQRISSRIKASIVSEYFPKYCKIIKLKHKPQRIGYFDLFSGPGCYKDGNASTPLLIARNCYHDSFLKDHVWMVFNDKDYYTELKENFEKEFPQGSFHFSPHFGHSIVGENEEIDKFIQKDYTKNGRNEIPSILFIDPFGYKNIETKVLSQFLRYWGNELFIFINTKRINPALENEKFISLMKCLFPTTYDTIVKNKKSKSTVQERLNYIIDNLGTEYENLLKKKVYYTAFKFQEEDSETTSHYILHLTKSSRGYDLIKQIYTDFANVGTIFDGVNTYTFDPKKINSSVQDLFDTSSENIDVLKDKLYTLYRGKEINALNLFESHQKSELYSRQHYVVALRRLENEGKLNCQFTDGKNHKVTVLLIKECILKFK